MPETVNRERRPGGVLATMRIRKKLLVLHTLFSGVLAVILVIALRPAVLQVVTSAEMDEAMMALRLTERGTLPRDPAVQLSRGTADELGLAADVADRAVEAAGRPVKGGVRGTVSRAVRLAVSVAEGEPAVFEVSSVRITDARRAVVELYVFVVLAVLGVYALIAIALEVFVLPQNVYGPIRRILDAEHALQTGDSRREIIDERYIPADELGEIMRSRNESVRTLRRQEIDLAEALQRFEGVATDLKRKNHLLEAARRNLADADRLASLGMMSAGIAHELNTPLTVVKGLAEKLEADPGHALAAEEARLLKRVVVRLEQLGESLLDFARVRPPVQRSVRVASLVREAETLVRLDRETRASQIVSRVDAELSVDCDGDRIVQVLVNLLRNSVDAQRASGVGGRVVIDAERLVREGREWLSVTITDDGPGIDQSVLETMFEPFVSSRLDAKGTGLGLAVAQGIVEEHGGVILARNRGDQRGAVFEVVLPAEASGRLSSEVPDVETTNGRDD
ncbi:MAG: HAMP domain-containing sensor histidine kinase [Planctomycetota bacterium]